MKNIKTNYLDKINNEKINKDEVLDLFKNLNNKDLEYSNTGYFELKISDENTVILHFSAIDKQNISLRYDKNIPDSRHGQCWYSVNDNESSEIIIEAGDENWIPKNSILSLDKAINIINDFFDDPLNMPTSVNWKNAEEFASD